MRNLTVSTITFTDKNGVQYPVKDMREYAEQETGTIINLRDGDYIDEIASRRDVYRTGSEDLSYQIIEANRIKIVDSDWDLSRLKQLIIPVINKL